MTSQAMKRTMQGIISLKACDIYIINVWNFRWMIEG
jgi:hypothetical protein